MPGRLSDFYECHALFWFLSLRFHFSSPRLYSEKTNLLVHVLKVLCSQFLFVRFLLHTDRYAHGVATWVASEVVCTSAT